MLLHAIPYTLHKTATLLFLMDCLVFMLSKVTVCLILFDAKNCELIDPKQRFSKEDSNVDSNQPKICSHSTFLRDLYALKIHSSHLGIWNFSQKGELFYDVLKSQTHLTELFR